MRLIYVLISLLYLCGFTFAANDLTVEKSTFGQTPCGQNVNIYTLSNANGMKIKLMDYGAALTSVIVPDKNNKFEDIALGYDNFDSYLCENPYFGGIVGRFGNRIASGRFKLDGTEYILNTNNNGQTLHGGIKGFDVLVWSSKPFENENGAGVEFNLLSPDGQEHFPGNLKITVIYTLTNNNEIMIDYTATTDKATPINLTQHGYWNLAGEGTGDILKYETLINADKFTPVDKFLIPTGQIKSVKNTPFDFTQPKTIGLRINNDDPQLKFGGGYDHNWVLNKKDNSLTLACKVSEPTSGRVFEVYTTEPAMQFYSGNFLDGKIIGKSGKAYNYRCALVLEPQHFPDSPNHPNFPNTILRPGQTYKSQTVYKFSCK
ncbi:MAG: aldose epimerase family protein [Phycisphaerales bacterium]